MIRVIVLLFLCLLFSPVFAAKQADVFMQAHLLNAEGEVTNSREAKVGQRVTLALDIYTSTWFTRAPELAPLSVAGAVALQAQGFGINYSEQRGGVRYAVQRRELSIFPQRDGQFIIPSQTARVWAAGDKGRAREALTVRSEPLVFQVTAVMPAEQSGDPLNVLVANGLQIEERFEPSLAQLTVGEKQLRAGDAIVRHVTLTAKGTLGMLIKPIHWPVIADVEQQSRRAQVSDRTVRGEFTGVRQESRSYVFERAGQYQLPVEDIYWWDAVNQRLVTRSLAPQTITVLASTLAVADEIETNPLINVRLKTFAAVLATVLAMITLGYLLWIIVRVLINHGEQWLQRYQSTPSYARRRLLRACARGDKDQIVRRFYQWQQHLPAFVLETKTGAELQAAMNSFYAVYYPPSKDNTFDDLSSEGQTAALHRLVVSVRQATTAASQFNASHVEFAGIKILLPRGRALVKLNPR